MKHLKIQTFTYGKKNNNNEMININDKLFWWNGTNIFNSCSTSWSLHRFFILNEMNDLRFTMLEKDSVGCLMRSSAQRGLHTFSASKPSFFIPFLGGNCSFKKMLINDNQHALIHFVVFIFTNWIFTVETFCGKSHTCEVKSRSFLFHFSSIGWILSSNY